MPIYEYQCRECGHEFEAMQKMSDPKLTDCPECAETALIKKISAVAFRLKGGGWYETDFKNSNKRQLHEESSKGESKKDTVDKGSDSKKTETNSSKSDNSSSKSSPKTQAASSP
ncbi:MAG: zinc ribbon domain-containing protein [Gammaproteobacteria bacterium]|nr:zinc ribbon domain-containing protein [Gammaproteobacteria bacterium]